jgi:hypothetical protein
MNPDRAAAFLKARVESGSVTWYDLAHFVAYYQAAHGLVVDGMPGEKTLTRLAGFVEEISGVHDLPEIARPDVRPTFDGPLDRVPRNRADVIALLGNPGKGTVDPSWFKANIITVRDLPGAAPDYHIERAASFVFRHQRHDKSRPLSYHSWGVSFDVDPGHNGSALFKPGQEPEPFSPAWRVRWPMGLPQAFVEAIESVGFAWGGRWKGFVDPMHFEFVGKTDVQV